MLLVAAIAVLVWQRRRTRLVDWILLVLFGAAYLSAVRNSNLLGLVAPVMIAAYLPWKRILPAWTEWAAAVLLIAAIAVPFARGRAFQLRDAEWKYPAGAADFLLTHHITQPMFNTYEKGGYLLWRSWPQERTFIDGRSSNETVFADYLRMERYLPGARRLLDLYGIQVVVMNSLRSQFRRHVRPAAGARGPRGEGMENGIRGCRRHHLHAPTSARCASRCRRRDFAGMEAQCQAILDHDPAPPALRPQSGKSLPQCA